MAARKTWAHWYTHKGRRHRLKLTEEELMQVTLYEWVQYQPPPVDLLHHVPNGGARDPRTGLKMLAMGTRAGVPDNHLPVASRGYTGLWIELKRPKGGSLSAAQKDWIRRLEAAGNLCRVCVTWEAAANLVCWYLHRRPPFPAEHNSEYAEMIFHAMSREPPKRGITTMPSSHSTDAATRPVDTVVMRLAHLLACYEADEPHVSSPGYDFGTEEEQSYQGPTYAALAEWQQMEHHGDCVKQPTTCLRCWSDHLLHKANWISQRLDA